MLPLSKARCMAAHSEILLLRGSNSGNHFSYELAARADALAL